MSCCSLADEHIASYPIFILGNNICWDRAASDEDKSHDELTTLSVLLFYLLQFRIYFRY